ncbi:hypothetical protein AB0M28_04435 [Streptomyces sp. NPDC051940]|uniref:GTP pyrophosphokinase n=1 Tax=Streptomyces sp. NPDC051940 TaxID=3155675 RepID=UPI003422F46D
MFGDDIPRTKALESYEGAYPLYQQFAVTLKNLTQNFCEQHGMKIQTVEARAKEPASVLGKLDRHPGYRTLSDIEDLCGVRVVTFYLDDIQRVRNMLRAEFEILKEESRQASSPDAFGYRSLHLIARLPDRRRELIEYRAFADLRIEFQVRTVLQHAWGVISHALDYKTENAVPAEVRRKLFRVAALLETGDELFGAFRSEVEAIRAGYEHQVTAEDWRALPLDLDSVIASRERLPVDEVVAVAERAGFSVTEQPHGVPESPSDFSLNNLLSLTSVAGAQTLGDFADLMKSTTQESDSLAELTRESRSRGFVPDGNPWDVVVLSMLFRDPDLRVRGAVPFREELEDSLDAVLRHREAK